jgi:predicted dinucleotide-binding enzyme
VKPELRSEVQEFAVGDSSDAGNTVIKLAADVIGAKTLRNGGCGRGAVLLLGVRNSE